MAAPHRVPVSLDLAGADLGPLGVHRRWRWGWKPGSPARPPTEPSGSAELPIDPLQARG